MSNKGSFTKITTDIILDDTIINQDIKTTANIDRNKMNEAQDILIKSGKKLTVNDIPNVSSVEISNDGTDAKIKTTVVNFIYEIATGLTKFLKAGVNSIVRCYGSGGINYILFGHDNTDGAIQTNAGNLNITPAADIYAKQNLRVRDGKILTIHNPTNTDLTTIYNNFGQTTLDAGAGGLEINTGNGNLIFRGSAFGKQFQIYSAANDKMARIGNWSGSLLIEAASGDITLLPLNSIDCSNKPIIAINDLTYNAAKTRYLSIGSNALTPENNTITYVKNYSGQYIRSNTIAQDGYYYVGVNLPHGAIVTSFSSFCNRTDAAALVWCGLQRAGLYGALSGLADANSAVATGDETITDNTITNPTIDNVNYNYRIYVRIQTNDNVDDCRWYGALITYTVDKPLP